MHYTIDQLKTQTLRPKDFLFFWGHQPSRDGSIIKTCMSQWWPATFEEKGKTYRTAEHYMMAEKARLFGDERFVKRSSRRQRQRTQKTLAGRSATSMRSCGTSTSSRSCGREIS